MLKADLHLHTHHSRDCNMSAETIISRCLRQGIDCLGVTDHNTIAGALEIQRLAPFKVIVGEEIKTFHGEIIGFFLQEEIPRSLSPQETVELIKAQGGLVCIPHPFDRLRRSPLKRHALESILAQVDIIEVFNSRTTLLSDSARAQRLAQAHHLLASAGSDAHTPGEIGRSYVEIPPFNDPDQFRSALAQGKVIGRRSNPLVHLLTAMTKLSNRLKPLS